MKHKVNIDNLIRKYLEIQKKIKKLVKSPGKNITENVGFYYIKTKSLPKNFLPIEINENTNEQGYDLTDNNKRKIEVKVASCTEKHGYCNVFNGWKNKKNKFDYALLVSLNSYLDCKFILKLSHKLVYELLSGKNNITISQKLVAKYISKKNNFAFLYIDLNTKSSLYKKDILSEE